MPTFGATAPMHSSGAGCRLLIFILALRANKKCWPTVDVPSTIVRSSSASGVWVWHSRSHWCHVVSRIGR